MIAAGCLSFLSIWNQLQLYSRLSTRPDVQYLDVCEGRCNLPWQATRLTHRSQRTRLYETSSGLGKVARLCFDFAFPRSAFTYSANAGI